jgi:hypothetical protein
MQITVATGSLFEGTFNINIGGNALVPQDGQHAAFLFRS